MDRDYPSENLPSVDDAKEIVAGLAIERQAAEAQQQQAEQLEALEADQAERREKLEAELAAERARGDQKIITLEIQQSNEQEALSKNHAKTNFEIEFSRATHKPQGLAAFLGRITGMEFIRQKLHERERGKREEAQRREAEQQRLQHMEQHQNQMHVKALLASEQNREHLVQCRIFDREKNALKKQNSREHTLSVNALHPHQAPLPDKLQQTKSSGSQDRTPKTIRVEDHKLQPTDTPNEGGQDIDLNEEFSVAAERQDRVPNGAGREEFQVTKDRGKGRER